MALKFTITSPSGVPAEYHRIEQVQYQKGEAVVVRVVSYLNQAAAVLGRHSLDVRFFDSLTLGSISELYAQLKQLPDYVSSEDC